MSNPSVQHYAADYSLPTGGKPFPSDHSYDAGEAAAMYEANQKHCNTAIRTVELRPSDIAPLNPGSASPVNVPEISSGGDNDYWVAKVTHPKRLAPYSAECEDLIELFQMTFQEGEAFKALWRKGQMRIGNGKPGDTHLRNAEKVRHFGERMEVMEHRNLAASPTLF